MLRVMLLLHNSGSVKHMTLWLSLLSSSESLLHLTLLLQSLFGNRVLLLLLQQLVLCQFQLGLLLLLFLEAVSVLQDWILVLVDQALDVDVDAVLDDHGQLLVDVFFVGLKSEYLLNLS